MDGVDTRDYPELCDAYISSADYDGQEMTEEELDWVTDNCGDFVHEMAHESLY